MKKRTFFISLFSTTILGIAGYIGYKTSQTDTPTNESHLSLNVINKDKPVNVELRDIVDSIQYTVLESSASCMLGEITRVKKTDGYYFVRDDFGLYAFDEEGHFINEISQKGNGNKEYVHLENFYIDEQQKAIGLICNPSPKIMFFSYDGEYLSTVRLPEEDGGIHSIMKSPDQDLLAYYPMPNDYIKIEHEYKKVEIKGNRLKTFPLLTMKDLTTKDIHYAFSACPMAIYKDTCYLLSVLSHNLYAYKNGEIKHAYQFDWAKQLPSTKFLKECRNENFYDLKEKIQESGMSIGFTDIQANKDYMFISVNNENTLIWDGRQSVLIHNTYDSERNFHFPNIALTGGCSDENIGFYNADILCQQKKQLPTRSQTFNRIVQSIKEEDNPVLYRFIFKKDLINHISMKYKLK